MGILRLFFALSIVLFHSGPLFGFTIANEYIAVCSFFVFSGFYMALILDKKYTNRKLFWINRGLRIYPLYLLVLCSMVFLALVQFLFHIGNDNAITHYLAHTSHTSLPEYLWGIGNFLIRNVTLIVTSDYFLKSDNTGGYLLVQQAWTLQIELIFYLLAPYLLMLRKKFLLTFTILYNVLFYLIISPLGLIPQYTLTYTFASYLLFFLLGMCSYSYLFTYIINAKISGYVPFLVTVFFMGYILLYNSIPFRIIPAFAIITDPFYYLLVTVSLPFIFITTRNSVLDNYIGKLSYPVYITHFLILKLLTNTPYFYEMSTLRTCVVLLLTLLLSIALVTFVENPLNNYRQHLLKKH